MQRHAPLFVDHFGWATTKEAEVIAFFESLGFHMGDKRKEGSTDFHMGHFYMDEDSSYINVYQLPEDGNMWPCKLDWVMNPDLPIEERLSDPAGVPGVYTFVLSTRDCDASREAAMTAGYKVGRVHRRRFEAGTELTTPVSYYESIGGDSSSDMFAFDLRVQPFPNMMLGVMEHTDRYHAHYTRKAVHEYHANGYNKISELTLYYETEEGVMDALKAIHKLHDTMRYTAEDGFYTKEMRLIDAKAYEKEFGVEAPKVWRSNVTAITFKNGDQDYVREQAEKHGYHHFDKNGKLYVDGRELLNAFLIFE